jgi:hypothetical protein
LYRVSKLVFFFRVLIQQHNVGSINISFSLFLFRIVPKNFIRGNAATNNTPNEGEKNHRGKVKEVETFQYFPLNHFCICLKLVNLFDT